MTAAAHEGAIARHALVRVSPSAWAAELASRPDLAGSADITLWAEREWPLVARRRGERDRSGYVALGLPLPPSQGKCRIAVDLPPSAILSVTPPPALAVLALPPPWHEARAALLALGDRNDATPRVFGSFAWASLTGLAYATAESDLDLLWPVVRDTPALLRDLASVESLAPGSIDGEVVGSFGGANWRELAGGGLVLAKSLDGVALVDAAAILGAVPV